MQDLSAYENQSNFLGSSKETKLFKKNQIIYKEREIIGSVYIILDGLVESYTSEKLKGKIINLYKGSTLGLIDTILERPLSRNMIAKSTVSLAVIEKNTIKNMLAENQFSGILIKSLAIDIDNKYPYTWS